MAEDDREELDENEEGAEGEQGKKAGSRKKWIMIAAVAVLLVAASVVGTLYLLGSFDEPDAETGEQEATSEAEEPAAIEPAIYFPLKPQFITNYEVRGRQRYMQVDMTLMLRDNTVVPAIELHMPAIRNALVMLMRGQDYRELQTPEGKELLRQQALLKVQQVLERETGEPGVEQVLFTNLVLQ